MRSDTAIDRDEVDRLIALRAGEPFEESRVRRTLRALRFSGLASEVAIYERPVEDGVVAVIAIWAATRVSAVELEGDLGLKADRLQAVIPFAAGQPLLEDRVVRGLYALKDLLIEEGYLESTVDLEVAIDAPTLSARILYRVAAGARTRIGQVRFEGAAGRFTDLELLKALRSGPGDPYRSRALRENLERLQQHLIESGYRTAKVERLAEESAPREGVVDLIYRLEPGLRFEVVVTGDRLQDLEKRDLLPFLDEGGYDDALVLQAVERIRTDYQKRGHYRVVVKRTESRSADAIELRLDIRPGERFTLEELTFEGNEAFSAERLATLMSTSPRRLLLPKSGRLVDQELGADLSNLRSFYTLEGFDHARVGPARIVEQGTSLTVVVPIVEGRRRTVGTLVLEGLAPLDERALRADLPLAEGGPFHRLRVEQSVDLTRAQLERLGFGSAIVASSVTWDEDELVAAVTLRALPGHRELVDAVVIRGLDRTDSAIVRRFVGLEPGDPVSRSALLEVQRRLYALGVFSRVDVRAPAATEVGDAREVLVEVFEGKAKAASIGFGYDSENGARGLLRLSHGNLFGRISSLTLDMLLSEREYHSRLIFRQPFLGSWEAEVLATLYDEHEERPDFVVDRSGAQVALQRRLGRWASQLLASYRIVELDAGEFNAEIPLDSRNARVASLTPGTSLDRRDDPIDPKRGWMATAQLEYAFPFADANARFLKLFSQASVYVPLGARTVFAASLRGGAIEPLASAPETRVADELELSAPAAELFYAGGRTSHRAYERDALGIVGETLIVESPGSPDDPFPAGGGGLLLANLELRFPIAGPVGGTLFADGGNVWRDYRDVTPGEMKWGAGLGVRYFSPVGPLRLEIGWKLDREPFEDPYVWYFSLGNAF